MLATYGIEEDCCTTLAMVFVPGPAIHEGHASISIELMDWDRAGDLASSLALFGWCVAHGGLALEVEFQLHGTVLAKADLHIPRPDVVAALARPGTPPGSGFHLRLSKLLIPPNAALDVMMWVERDGEISRVALGRIENLPPARLRTSYAERCQPLLLLGLGRSGTTYAMRLLSGHKDILVPGGHPYELRTPAWLWHAAHVLSAPGADASMHPDGFESRDAGRLGYNPYRSRDWEGVAGSDAAVRWQEEALPGAAVDFCKRQVDDFVLRCAGGRQPRYVAQKMLLSPTRYVVRNIYPGAREVFLLRDFRDIWLSARSFNRRRGGESFGRDGFADDLAWLRGLAFSTRQLRLAHAAAGPDAVTLHYEDLMGDPARAIARVLRELGLDARPDQVGALVAAAAGTDGEARAHQTAGGAAGRWRTEMTPDERAAAADAFGDDLRYFGYAA